MANSESGFSRKSGMMYFAGIDIGSTMTKAVIIDEAENISGYVLGPSGAEHRRLANWVMREALDKVGIDIDDIVYIVSTGYGRVNVPFADADLTEITCHARGVSKWIPQAHTIIDIGGQDSKGIRVKDGRVANFVMNDKCAAGTGRFLEIIAEILGVKIEDLADLSLQASEKVNISNICTAFAGQEVMSFLAEGIAREKIAAGLHNSLAKRICNMVNRIGIVKEVVITGGGAKNKALVKDLEFHLNTQVQIPPEPLVSGALGAAVIGRERALKALAAGNLVRKERELEEARFFNES
jgi:(R)-2-hydroxyacyl-CoA dehydratese activating ATPase